MKEQNLHLTSVRYSNSSIELASLLLQYSELTKKMDQLLLNPETNA